MILANEIQQPQYSGMSDAEIAAALNAVSATTRRAVPLAWLASGPLRRLGIMGVMLRTVRWTVKRR